MTPVSSAAEGDTALAISSLEAQPHKRFRELPTHEPFGTSDTVE